MTVAELESSMSSEEFTEWGAYCTIEAREMEAKNKAAGKGSSRDNDAME